MSVGFVISISWINIGAQLAQEMLITTLLQLILARLWQHCAQPFNKISTTFIQMLYQCCWHDWHNLVNNLVTINFSKVVTMLYTSLFIST